MGAYTFVNNKKIKIWKVKIINKEEFVGAGLVPAQELEKTQNGGILLANDKQGLFLKAKDAVLEVLEMQAEGSKRMNAKDYLRGNKI